jgi:hypothetical protein
MEARPSEADNEGFSFTPDQLHHILTDSPEELCNLLQKEANKCGFALACADSKFRHWNTLECTYATKNENGTITKCPFFVKICARSIASGRPGAGHFVHVTHYELTHSHDLNPLLFMHKILNAETLQILHEMAQFGVRPRELASYLRTKKGITLSTMQIRNLLYSTAPYTATVCESIEVEQGMDMIGGKSWVMEHEQNSRRVRTAIATFTMEELHNLANFGDVVGIDATFLPVNLNWSAYTALLYSAMKDHNQLQILFRNQ